MQALDHTGAKKKEILLKHSKTVLLTSFCHVSFTQSQYEPWESEYHLRFNHKFRELNLMRIGTSDKLCPNWLSTEASNVCSTQHSETADTILRWVMGQPKGKMSDAVTSLRNCVISTLKSLSDQIFFSFTVAFLFFKLGRALSYGMSWNLLMHFRIILVILDFKGD